MSRILRPHLPGVPFHITARIQGRDPLFSGIEEHAARIIEDADGSSDGRLACYAIMPNHIHIILIQGSQPLAAFTGPVLTRLALLVRRRTGRQGHVFERRYHDSACLDAEYLRNAIAYVHLNGARAGLCRGADDFAWCTHRGFASEAELARVRPRAAVAENLLRLFARHAGQNITACIEDYRAFLSWRLLMDRYLAACEAGVVVCPPYRRDTLGGDIHWASAFGAVSCVTAESRWPRRPADLRDFMKTALGAMDPDADLDLLRYGGSTRPLVKLRRHLILQALIAGHSGRRIAAFLHVAESTVSGIRTGSRITNGR